MVNFPMPWRNLWNDWDIRVFVLTSLLLQILLIIFSPLRKRKASKTFALFIWSVYLLADWVAAFALGLLCNTQGKSDCNDAAKVAGGGSKIIKTTGAATSRHGATTEYNDKLLAFWAPFLLLHLGGPDTITAFAMEDNELWPRHLLALLFEVGAAVYVFLLSIPKNSFLAPTLLMFVAGIVKYGERTFSLYRASMDGFRKSILEDPDPGPNYAKLMEEYQSKRDSGVPAYIKISEEPKDTKTDIESGTQQQIEADEKKRQEQQTEDEKKRKQEQKTEGGEKNKQEQQTGDKEVGIIQEAHKFFDKFKGLIVELIFSFHERNESRTAFLKKNPQEAFRVVEYELSFVYEVLFTKAVVVHHRYGYVLRAICTCSIMGAFLSFFFLSKKHNFSALDKSITYALLGGAISLDALAFIMLILSDWTVVKLSKSRFEIPKVNISGFLAKIPPRKRWSVTVTQHNLINYCIPAAEESYLERIKDRPTIWGKLDEIFCIQKPWRWIDIGVQLMDEIQYTWRLDVTDALKVFIFEELRKRAEGATNLKETRHMCSCKGDWALNERGYLGEFGYSVEEVEFDESLLLWHIATDLCYYTDEEMGKNEESDKRVNKDDNIKNGKGKKSNEQEKRDDVHMREEKTSRDDISVSIKASVHRRFCKVLSDYLVYLLVMRPIMMASSAVIGQIRYRDTCAEVKNFLRRRSIKLDDKSESKEHSTPQGRAEKKQCVGCSNLLSVNTEVKPIDVKGDRSKSVLFDACILAKKLKKLEVEKRWEMMCEVLTEMLIYAAGRCPGIAHAQRVSKGGELLTFVWFLMTHLGLGEQYRIEAGHARAKLIVDK